MGFLNKVILLGNVTRNPEVRYIPGSGTPVATFGLAVNRRYKQGDETREETCFIDIVAFSRLAEFAGEYVAKGISILVEGRLSYRTWEQDGQKRSKHEIVAENIQLVWRKDRTADASDLLDDTNSDTFDEDDIPF
ncbi:single-strand DNA binding protein [Deferribacter desulfuricans SSM1]|uniref:Single-stranded DNA-binding protein n=1 Tax=Deferribacter desulfuricans (strain DSM 14783 / JCM 11476 / NBRC 101012 / SSM1) TaxID=639282 RepID=D3P9P9_DEFDS|nr:single-stranded DNA-binding protein [Deferribacter desulfuricans]BAI81439.1 single-strand DNA binding protein [Deferribacter desulfuricans SSM1]